MRPIPFKTWQAERLVESDPLTQQLWEATRQHATHCADAAAIMRQLPGKFLGPVRKRWERLVHRSGLVEANRWLAATVTEALDRIKLGHAQDDEAIRAEAKRRAADCARILGPIPSEKSFAHALTFARWHRVDVSGLADGARSLRGAPARLRCELWWRRKLRVRDGRAVEMLGRSLNLINRRAQCYASDEAVERRRQQRARNRALLAVIEAENDAGQVTTLEALHDKSVSNPTMKRAELMTRIRGFEEYANEQGHQGEFFTVSCPSKYHRAHADSGLENPRWNGTSPRDAQRYLCRLWARARAALQRAGITPYGFRIAEPHHDGCPHWHLLLFVDPAQADALAAILEREALREDGHEPGAARHRFKRETIDPAKGTAAGYVAKYVSKNIDGFRVGDDLFGGDAVHAAARVDAWASTWGIRQFQQIGGPPVGIWRELRRGRYAAVSPVIEAARVAADRGEWRDFCRCMGLRRVGRAPWPLRLLLASCTRHNRYGEPASSQVEGITDGTFGFVTRLYSWVFSFVPGRSSGPWTRVNNCTQSLQPARAGP